LTASQFPSKIKSSSRRINLKEQNYRPQHTRVRRQELNGTTSTGLCEFVYVTDSTVHFNIVSPEFTQIPGA
jgi:hypothetical protein